MFNQNWVDYKTKYFDYIDKYIFKNLALCKKGYDRELDWDNQLTIDGMRNVEFQKIIIGNKSNRDVFK